MADPEAIRERLASAAAAEQIASLGHDPSPRVIRALLENPNISEEDVRIIASRKNLPGDILEFIARNRRWAESYPVRLAVARNPKTPLFAALSIVRYLRLFDQVQLTRNTALPVIFRQKVEALIMEKIPTMAMGVKRSLAKIAAGNVLLKLIQDGYPEVVSLCLGNPYLVEAHLYRIINREATGPATIRLIAEHANWSSRYYIRYALVRSAHTPLARSVIFLSGMKTEDLRELYIDPSLPPGIQPCIHRELRDRGEDTDKALSAQDEQVIEFGEEEAMDIERDAERYGPESGGEESGEDD